MYSGRQGEIRQCTGEDRVYRGRQGRQGGDRWRQRKTGGDSEDTGGDMVYGNVHRQGLRQCTQTGSTAMYTDRVCGNVHRGPR